MSPDPSESGAGSSRLGNTYKNEQYLGVNPENLFFLCDGIKCEPIDPETVQKEETHQQVEQSELKHQCA